MAQLGGWRGADQMHGRGMEGRVCRALPSSLWLTCGYSRGVDTPRCAAVTQNFGLALTAFVCCPCLWRSCSGSRRS